MKIKLCVYHVMVLIEILVNYVNVMIVIMKIKIKNVKVKFINIYIISIKIFLNNKECNYKCLYC